MNLLKNVNFNKSVKLIGFRRTVSNYCFVNKKYIFPQPIMMNVLNKQLINASFIQFSTNNRSKILKSSKKVIKIRIK